MGKYTVNVPFYIFSYPIDQLMFTPEEKFFGE